MQHEPQRELKISVPLQSTDVWTANVSVYSFVGFLPGLLVEFVKQMQELLKTLGFWQQHPIICSEKETLKRDTTISFIRITCIHQISIRRTESKAVIFFSTICTAGVFFFLFCFASLIHSFPALWFLHPFFLHENKKLPIQNKNHKSDTDILYHQISHCQPASSCLCRFSSVIILSSLSL